MPGAGSYAAGSVPAGYEPGATSEAVAKTLPRAALFQLATADYPLDSTGQFVDVHPNDQWVALQLSTRFGTLYSLPSMGHKLRTVTRVTPAKALMLVTDIVNMALAERVDSGAIRIEVIEVDTSTRGTLLVAVTYRNMALMPSRTTTFRSNLAA